MNLCTEAKGAATAVTAVVLLPSLRRGAKKSSNFYEIIHQFLIMKGGAGKHLHFSAT
jgi:hypothetical protein